MAFMLALPVAGMAADRFRSTTLIMIGLVIYLFIGAGYFLAGALGLVIFIVMARFLNGISYALDSLGRDTYIRRHTPKHKLATVFGYFDTIADFWWIAAALSGIWLIRHFEIHELYFMIIPTSLISLLIIWRFRVKKEEKMPSPAEGRLRGAYAEMFREMSAWPFTLRTLATFNFFVAFGSAAVAFFLPIEAYAQGANLGKAILISVAPVVPTLFGWVLGKWFDRKGTSLFLYGFLAFAGLISFLAFSDSYATKLLVALGIGVVVELLLVGGNELITLHANPEHFGRVGGIMRTVFSMGAMTGPLAVGILIDWQGAHASFLTLAILMFVLATAFYFIKDKLRAGMEASGTKTEAGKYHHKKHQRHTSGVHL
jgi:MFS family permease